MLLFMIVFRGCQSSVNEALQKFPGVANVDVNLETKTATITLKDVNAFPVQDAVAKLTELGYPAKKLV